MNEENIIENDIGTLRAGEIHPMAKDAFQYIKNYILKNNDNIYSFLECLNNSALSGNRLAEVCGETLRRILENEPFSDRYLLGLAWFLMKKEDFIKIEK